jgi:hypothetical protein
MKVNVLNNGQLHAVCEDLMTATYLIRMLERNIDRSVAHSPFTIEVEEPVVEESNQLPAPPSQIVLA